MTISVELRRDRGAAAVDAEFFRSPGFMEAEGVTHSLMLESDAGRAVFPLIVRDVPGSDLPDAISPYGYPGGVLEGQPMDPRRCDFTGIGLVSVFLRDRLGSPCLLGGTNRGTVCLHDPGVERRVSKSFRRDVRRNQQHGCQVSLVRAADIDDVTLEGFAECYRQTMRRVKAADRYFVFGVEYLRRCMAYDDVWLARVHRADGQLAAGELAVLSDGMLHSYLAGTMDEDLSWSPGKNATMRLIDHADELGMLLNFGGGVQSGDGVQSSKLSYSNGAASFVTHELVVDRDRYEALSGGRADDREFFPAYRRSR